MNILRWVGLLPGAIIAWYFTLFVGIGYVELLDWLCPPELMISGFCTASWHEPALNAGVVFGAGLAAAFVMLTVITLAPSYRGPVAAVTFGVGSIVALYMAYESGTWAAFVSVTVVGAMALAIALRKLT